VEECPCGALNPEGADKCARCGEPLSVAEHDPHSKRSVANIGCAVLLGLALLMIIVGAIVNETRAPVESEAEEARSKQDERKQMDRGCRIAIMRYESKPISELTLEEIRTLEACRLMERLK
jgi:hypothetical protein